MSTVVYEKSWRCVLHAGGESDEEFEEILTMVSMPYGDSPDGSVKKLRKSWLGVASVPLVDPISGGTFESG